MEPTEQVIYFTRTDILKDFFKDSKRVTYDVFLAEGAVANTLARTVGSPLKLRKYVVFVAQTLGKIDGYAFIGEEKGERFPIRVAVKLTAEGKVNRTTVIAHQDRHADDLQEARFMSQFIGKGMQDPVEVNRDITPPQGASSSARAVARVVKLAIAVTDIVRSERMAK